MVRILSVVVVGCLIVAAVMVTLPLVYVAIVGLVVVAVLYHAVHNISIFQHVRGGNAMNADFRGGKFVNSFGLRAPKTSRKPASEAANR